MTINFFCLFALKFLSLFSQEKRDKNFITQKIILNTFIYILTLTRTFTDCQNEICLVFLLYFISIEHCEFEQWLKKRNTNRVLKLPIFLELLTKLYLYFFIYLHSKFCSVLTYLKYINFSIWLLLLHIFKIKLNHNMGKHWCIRE